MMMNDKQFAAHADVLARECDSNIVFARDILNQAAEKLRTTQTTEMF
jgi:hypothetical protein